MIRVSRLTKRFSHQLVLDDISLEINHGEILVVLGESGAGKSVLLKHIIGLLKPDSGQVSIDGVEITALPERELLKIRRTMGYLFQEGALYDFFSVFENISFPLKEHTTLSPEIIKQKVNDILKLIDLEGVGEKYPSELSGGMKKRVALARSIVLNCKILLCDEPTSGLDPIRSRDISDLIRNVSKKINCTTVITSHDIDNTFRIADRIALIHDGKIAALGTKDELKVVKDPFVQEFIR